MFQLKRLVISRKKDFFQILHYLKELIFLLKMFLFDHDMFSMAGEILWRNKRRFNGKSIAAC
jgi:hypothetical protein